MKHDIEWHKECLRNMHGLFQKLSADYERLRAEIYSLRQDINLRRIQIDEAKKRCYKSFDETKLCIKRRL